MELHNKLNIVSMVCNLIGTFKGRNQYVNLTFT